MDEFKYLEGRLKLIQREAQELYAWLVASKLKPNYGRSGIENNLSYIAAASEDSLRTLLLLESTSGVPEGK